VIAQLETDKVTIDVKYTGKEPGVLTSLHIKPQDVLQVRARTLAHTPGLHGMSHHCNL
jgi:hypothetical protein